MAAAVVRLHYVLAPLCAIVHKDHDAQWLMAVLLCLQGVFVEVTVISVALAHVVLGGVLSADAQLQLVVQRTVLERSTGH